MRFSSVRTAILSGYGMGIIGRSMYVLFIFLILTTAAMAGVPDRQGSEENSAPGKAGSERIAFGPFRGLSEADDSEHQTEAPVFWRSFWTVSAFIFLVSSLIGCLAIIRTLRNRVVGKSSELIEKERLLSTLTGKVPEVASHGHDPIDGASEDIAGTKETERLRIERDAAEAASKAKSDFLANIGHEIRTPLNSILGFSQILKAQLRDERLQQYTQAITTSGNTLLRLINDLLDLSKIESGKFELQPTAVDLQRMAREIRLVFMPSVDEKQLEFLVDLDPEMPETLFIDEVRLRQILFNLLKNAFKFTDKGSISLFMRAIARNQPGAVDLEIVVADTGIGIPPEEQETIFAAFTQRKRQDQSKYAGTGLGLSITRRLVEIIGGGISLHSEVGKGSTFSVVLRDIPVAGDDTRSRLPGENEGLAIRFDEEAVILVIDAVDSNRMLIREFLRSTKLSIVETISVADGIEWCMAIKPDLILLDYTMSFIPDPNLVQRFNRVKEDLNIPIVVVTSATGVGSDDFQTNFHFDGWLRKPLLFEDVMQTLARFLPHSTFYRVDESPLGRQQEEYTLPDPEEVRQAVAGLKGRLPALRRILVGNLMEQWKENRETCIINEMKTFAEEIQRMSAEFELDFFAVWARVLLGQIRIFDMERVPVTFDLFTKLVDMIEQCSNSEPSGRKGVVHGDL